MYSSNQLKPFFQSPSQNNDGLFSAFLTDKKSELQPEILTKVKNELSKKWLKKDGLDNIHAIGIGKSERHEDCIQVFTNNAESFTAEIPKEYAKIPVVLFEMPQASFLSNGFSDSKDEKDHIKIARSYHDEIVGGISGANVKLGNEGTIGYFCRRKSDNLRRKNVFILSNSHIFAELDKTSIDKSDVIEQPSHHDFVDSRAIAVLTQFVPLKFDNNQQNPNYIDAAIAKLLRNQRYKLHIPFIGKISGVVKKEEIRAGSDCQKFGRTTGLTKGKIFSTQLDIFIKYAGNKKYAFFKDQILIAPEKPKYEKFVSEGDSGAVVVNSKNKAVGLVFAGANKDTKFENKAALPVEKIRNYGVANPISEVLSRLDIELILED